MIYLVLNSLLTWLCWRATPIYTPWSKEHILSLIQMVACGSRINLLSKICQEIIFIWSEMQQPFCCILVYMKVRFAKAIHGYCQWASKQLKSRHQTDRRCNLFWNAYGIKKWKALDSPSCFPILCIVIAISASISLPYISLSLTLSLSLSLSLYAP